MENSTDRFMRLVLFCRQAIYSLRERDVSSLAICLAALGAL